MLHNAAVVVQKCWRQHLAKAVAAQLRAHKAASIIQVFSGLCFTEISHIHQS